MPYLPRLKKYYGLLLPAAEFFWAPALVLALLHWVFTSQRFKGEALDWAMYYALALGFASITLLVLCARRLGTHRMFQHSWIRQSLGLLQLLCLLYALRLVSSPVIASYYAFEQPQTLWRLWLICMLAVSLVIARDWKKRPLNAEYILTLLFMSWLAFITLHTGFKLYWTSFIPATSFVFNRAFDWPSGQNLLVLALVLWACLHITWQSAPRPRTPLTPQQLWLTIWLMVALTLCTFLIHARITDRPGWHPLIHWSALYTPAMWVRQGGWPLWDVMTQYGTGVTLLLALMPFESLWNSLFYTHAILQTLATILICCLLQRPQRLLSPFIAYICALGATHFLYHLCFGPSNIAPPAATLRFLWAHAGLLWAYGIFALRHTASHNRLRQLWLCGIPLWIMGVFWSAESSVFTTATIVPAFFAFGFMLRARTAEQVSLLFYAHSLAHDAGLLLAGMASFLFLLCLYYLAFLGYLPDLMMHYDVATSYKNGFGAIGLNYSGTVQCQLLAGLVIFGALIHHLLRSKTLFTDYWAIAAVLGACLLAIFSTALYGINRSTDNVFTTLSTVLLVCIAIAGRVSAESSLPLFSAQALRLLLGVFCACYVYIAYDKRESIAREFNETSFAFDINARVFDPDHPLYLITQSLRDKKYVSYEYFYHSFEARQGFDFYQGGVNHWLPSGDYIGLEGSTISPFTSEQLMRYYERFSDRVCNKEGWLIAHSANLREKLPTLAHLLWSRYRLESSVRQGDYDVQHYIRTQPCPLAPKPWLHIFPSQD